MAIRVSLASPRKVHLGYAIKEIANKTSCPIFFRIRDLIKRRLLIN